MTFQSHSQPTPADRVGSSGARGTGTSAGGLERRAAAGDSAALGQTVGGGPETPLEAAVVPPSSPSQHSRSAEVEAVYRRDGRELWALFYAQCHDRDRAHDALQEAFTRLQEQDAGTIRDARAWVLRVGRNWLRDVARRQRVAAKTSAGLDDLPHEAPDGREEPDRQLEHAELLAQVREGLAHMKAEDREVLVLRYALGWSSGRIAKVLNGTPAAVDMRLSRARRRLARYLESIGAHE